MRGQRQLAAFLVLFAAMAATPRAARAQVSRLPPGAQKALTDADADWRTNRGRSVRETVEAFRDLLRTAPTAGVAVTRDLAYGADPLQVLDVYRPETGRDLPVVIFVHGGAYTGGDKDAPGWRRENVPVWFARHGVVAINANYRLAPAAPWPAAARDVGGMVAWARRNVTRFGGDPHHIFLVGHSAGATHVASYVFDRSLQPADGPGIAGAVVMSGRYHVVADPTDLNEAGVRAYFGADPAAWAARSPISHVKDGPRVPVFVVICEYENPSLDVWGAELFAALCARDGVCPRFLRLEGHNHLSEVAAFNTPDEELGREILDFMGVSALVAEGTGTGRPSPARPAAAEQRLMSRRTR